jgi:hypothetical protein
MLNIFTVNKPPRFGPKYAYLGLLEADIGAKAEAVTAQIFIQ